MHIPIKSLLIGMLASVALVGCTDDVLENGGNEQQEVKFGDAYISLAISPSTNSSRAEGAGYGDEDGDAECSGHTNNGTAQESAIDKVLVVLTAGTTNTAEGQTNGIAKLYPSTILSPEGGAQKLNTVYRMGQIGKYKALVIINPVPEVVAKYNELEDDHYELYNKIVSMPVKAAYYVAEDGKTYFMMSNKKQIEIEVTDAHNSESTPAGLKADEIIEVERTISKITYRWTPALEKDSEGVAVNKAVKDLGANVYEIAVNGLAYQSVTEKLWFQDENKNMKYATFNKAMLGETEYWVLFKDGAGELTLNGGQFEASDIYGVYTKTKTTSKGYIGTGKEVDADAVYTEDGYVTDVVAEIAEIEDLTELVLERAANPTSISDQYFVKLEKYRLVNHNKQVYAVRHIADINYNEKKFGALGVQDYLVDPFTSDKNEWTSGPTDEDWFENPYLTVMESRQTLAGATDLPGSLNTKEEADGDGSQPVEGDKHNDLKTTGAFLSYCFENAVAANQQVFDLVTGIVFQGQMYDKDGNKISKAYSYSADGGYTKTIYRTLRELLDNEEDITGITENSTDEEAAKVEGLDVYPEGKCFYYTAKIKHFDNYKEDEVGVMEYAIMRNNIYSLSVEGIKGIGMSTLTPKSGQLVEDQSAYITMQAKIMPWIVRFNEIEL